MHKLHVGLVVGVDTIVSISHTHIHTKQVFLYKVWYIVILIYLDTYYLFSMNLWLSLIDMCIC